MYIHFILYISGGDDGFLHIWDLRQFTGGSPVGTFKHHTAPVTSVEWHYSEPSVVASAGEDNQVALWDLAVERDDDEVVDEELKVIFTILLMFCGLTKICKKSSTSYATLACYGAPGLVFLALV